MNNKEELLIELYTIANLVKGLASLGDLKKTELFYTYYLILQENYEQQYK